MHLLRTKAKGPMVCPNKVLPNPLLRGNYPDLT